MGGTVEARLFDGASQHGHPGQGFQPALEG